MSGRPIDRPIAFRSRGQGRGDRAKEDIRCRLRGSSQKYSWTTRGVTIYHIYADDYLEGGTRAYWYGTRPSCADDGSGEGGEFDVRDLPRAGGARYDEEEGRRAIIRAAIDAGLLTEGGIVEGADRENG